MMEKGEKMESCFNCQQEDTNVQFKEYDDVFDYRDRLNSVDDEIKLLKKKHKKKLHKAKKRIKKLKKKSQRRFNTFDSRIQQLEKSKMDEMIQELTESKDRAVVEKVLKSILEMEKLK